METTYEQALHERVLFFRVWNASVPTIVQVLGANYTNGPRAVKQVAEILA